jgi:hypothetical protein
MKLRMTVIYNDEICEDLKEAFNCDTDEQLLGAFKMVMAQALRQEACKDEDIVITCEIVD